MILIPVLMVGVAAYFIWRHYTSSLTRQCRWRMDRASGVWRCAACGGSQPIAGDSRDAPRHCARSQRP